jgi:hypothetical protein
LLYNKYAIALHIGKGVLDRVGKREV